MSLDGKWDVTLSTPMGAQPGVLTLNSSDGALSGSFSGEQGTQEFSGGTVDGDRFGWTNKVAGPMGDLELTWDGRLEGDEIAGSVQFGAFGSGSFKGTRAS